MQFKQLAGGLLPGHGTLSPWGVLFHTTGNGVPAKAVAEGTNFLEAAIRVYRNMREGPHLVLSPTGEVVQIRDFSTMAWHAGVTAEQRLRYLHEDWEAQLPLNVRAWWKARWPNYPSPQHLYPTSSPNLAYIGVEMVPCGVMADGKFEPWHKPAHPGARFTLSQYITAAQLASELSKRYKFLPDTGSARVCGHEDVNPVTRPGWDPGSMTGAFDWNMFNEVLETLERNG